MNYRIKLLLAISLTLGIPCVFFSSPSNISINSFNKKPDNNFYKHKKHFPDDSLNSVKSYSNEIKKRVTNQYSIDQVTSDNYIKNLEEVVSDNFIHSNLKYRSEDHWLAYIIEKTNVPKFEDILNVINPNHLAFAKHGMCSQQAILVQEILKYDGHNYASIRFTSPEFGHFASAAFINDKSYFIDTNMMPGHSHDGEMISRLLTKKSPTAKNLYLPWNNFKDMTLSIDDFSSYPARNGLIFQKIIFFLEKWIWLIPLIIILILKHKKLLKIK